MADPKGAHAEVGSAAGPVRSTSVVPMNLFPSLPLDEFRRRFGIEEPREGRFDDPWDITCPGCIYCDPERRRHLPI